MPPRQGAPPAEEFAERFGFAPRHKGALSLPCAKEFISREQGDLSECESKSEWVWEPESQLASDTLIIMLSKFERARGTEHNNRATGDDGGNGNGKTTQTTITAVAI